MRARFLLCAIVPFLLTHGAVAGTPQQPPSHIEVLAELMLHDFATAPDNFNETIIDRRVAAEVEGKPGIWFYSQLNTGDEQKVYRQRFHHLTMAEDGVSVIQRSYAPANADRFANGWDRDGAFAELSAADMKPVLGDGCAQIWTFDPAGYWRGSVDPATCTIFSERRQRSIRIGADSFYRDDFHGTSERGFDDNMNPIWGSKPGEFIMLKRCETPKCADEARDLSNRTE